MNLAERITLISILVTTTVGLAEFTAGTLFGSIAVVVAGIDAIADTFTSVGLSLGCACQGDLQMPTTCTVIVKPKL